jgi:hypothetical protein
MLALVSPAEGSPRFVVVKSVASATHAAGAGQADERPAIAHHRCDSTAVPVRRQGGEKAPAQQSVVGHSQQCQLQRRSEADERRLCRSAFGIKAVPTCGSQEVKELRPSSEQDTSGSGSAGNRDDINVQVAAASKGGSQD